jgi:hypothetical protein
MPSFRPAVEVAAYLCVDLVIVGPPGSRDAECLLALRRRLPVLGVVVPAAADRLTVVEEYAEAAPCVAVEVLHQQTS